MTTENYLSRMSWLLNMIQSKSEMSVHERGKALNMVAPMDGDRVQTSVRDTLADIMSKVADNDTEIRAYVEEYRTIKAQVDTLTGEYSPAFVYRRYAMNQSINEITQELNVSRSSAYRIRGEALKEFEKKYGKTYKKVKSFL